MHTDSIENTTRAIGFNSINADFWKKVKLLKNQILKLVEDDPILI